MSKKLSQAIKEGAEGRKQLHGQLLSYNSSDLIMKTDEDWFTIDGCCAIGAAALGTMSLSQCFHHTHAILYDVLRYDYPILFYMVELPDMPGTKLTVENALIHLNDTARWSFKKIIKWLEQVEVEYEANQTPNN